MMSMSRAVGIAGMKPLFGVRAIAEAAGLDGREVVALVESGRGHVVAALAAGRAGWDEYLRRSATEITEPVDWDELLRSANEITLKQGQNPPF